jgi:hypothetical protein
MLLVPRWLIEQARFRSAVPKSPALMPGFSFLESRETRSIIRRMAH